MNKREGICKRSKTVYKCVFILLILFQKYMKPDFQCIVIIEIILFSWAWPYQAARTLSQKYNVHTGNYEESKYTYNCLSMWHSLLEMYTLRILKLASGIPVELFVHTAFTRNKNISEIQCYSVIVANCKIFVPLGTFLVYWT